MCIRDSRHLLDADLQAGKCFAGRIVDRVDFDRTEADVAEVDPLDDLAADQRVFVGAGTAGGRLAPTFLEGLTHRVSPGTDTEGVAPVSRRERFVTAGEADLPVREPDLRRVPFAVDVGVVELGPVYGCGLPVAEIPAAEDFVADAVGNIDGARR